MLIVPVSDSGGSASLGGGESHWGYPSSGYGGYNTTAPYSYPTEYPPSLDPVPHFSS